MRAPDTDAPIAPKTTAAEPAYRAVLPRQRELFYGGAWHKPAANRYYRSISPATGDDLGPAAVADAEDIDRAVKGAHAALPAWRAFKPSHRAAARVEAGYVWINDSSSHFLGAPFGGYEQSGLGREECLEELLDCTQIKNVNVNFAI